MLLRGALPTRPGTNSNQTSVICVSSVVSGTRGTNQYRVYNIAKRVELVRDIRFQEDEHRPKEQVVSDISANHEPSMQDQATPHHSQKRPREEGPDCDGPPSKRTRSRDGPYNEALFADCQQCPESRGVVCFGGFRQEPYPRLRWKHLRHPPSPSSYRRRYP